METLKVVLAVVVFMFLVIAFTDDDSYVQDCRKRGGVPRITSSVILCVVPGTNVRFR